MYFAILVQSNHRFQTLDNVVCPVYCALQWPSNSVQGQLVMGCAGAETLVPTLHQLADLPSIYSAE